MDGYGVANHGLNRLDLGQLTGVAVPHGTVTPRPFLPFGADADMDGGVGRRIIRSSARKLFITSPWRATRPECGAIC